MLCKDGRPNKKTLVYIHNRMETIQFSFTEPKTGKMASEEMLLRVFKRNRVIKIMVP